MFTYKYTELISNKTADSIYKKPGSICNRRLLLYDTTQLIYLNHIIIYSAVLLIQTSGNLPNLF